jgi:tetratricopeptide (TPR) repeat protein
MSFQLKPLALASFAALLLSLPALSQTVQVEGTVKGPDGKPVANAVIKFDRTDIKGSYSVKTDKKGHYGHYGLPFGTFDVSVVVDGQVKDVMHAVKPKTGEPAEINFDLKASDGSAGLTPEADQERGMTKEQKDAFEKANKGREQQLAKNKALNDAYSAGKTALDAKQYDQAVDSLTKATALDEKQVAVWAALADAYVGSAGQKPGPDGEALYQKGFDAFKKAIELKPDDAAYYNNYALALAKDKKIDDAKTNLDKAAQLDPPGAGKYFYNMGALLVNSNQNEAAGEEFKKAIAADPNYADAQFQYGLFLAGKATTDATGKIVPPPGTIEALQKYLDLKPDGPMAQQAKDMIAGLGGSVNVQITNPKAPASGKKK